MLLASCGSEVKFHKWPSCDYVATYTIPEANYHTPSVSWCCEGEVLITTIPSFGPPLLISLINGTDAQPLRHLSRIHSVAFSKTVQNNVVLGNDAGHVLLYDLQRRKIVHRLPDLLSEVKFLEYGVQDCCLVAGCKNGQICLYDQSGHVCASFYVPLSSTLSAMGCHETDPQLLAGASHEGIVAVWDITSSNTKFVEKVHFGAVTDVAFSRGYQIATVGIDYKLNGHDLRAKERIFTCTNDCQLTSVAFTPNDELMAVATIDGKLHCYDKRKVACPIRTILAHHPKTIGRIAFQPLSCFAEFEEDENVNEKQRGDLSSSDSEATADAGSNRAAKSNYSASPTSSLTDMPKRSLAEWNFVPASGDFEEIPLPVTHGKTILETEIKSTRLEGIDKSEDNPSSFRLSSECSQDKQIALLKKELLDANRNAIETLVELMNKEFLKIRMAASRGFVAMEYKMDSRWSQFHLSFNNFFVDSAEKANQEVNIILKTEEEEIDTTDTASSSHSLTRSRNASDV